MFSRGDSEEPNRGSPQATPPKEVLHNQCPVSTAKCQHHDCISTDLCSLSYASIVQAARLVRATGHGAIMAKLHLCSVHRKVIIHPQEYHLLATKWQGVTYYAEKALPFVLCSAPNAVGVYMFLPSKTAWTISFSALPSSYPACGWVLETAIPLCVRLLVVPGKLKVHPQ